MLRAGGVSEGLGLAAAICREEDRLQEGPARAYIGNKARSEHERLRLRLSPGREEDDYTAPSPTTDQSTSVARTASLEAPMKLSGGAATM